MIQVIILTILSLFLMYSILGLIRNSLVHTERSKMIDTIERCHRSQKIDGIKYLTLFEAVSYNDMMSIKHFFVFPISKMWPKELQDIRNS